MKTIGHNRPLSKVVSMTSESVEEEALQCTAMPSGLATSNILTMETAAIGYEDHNDMCQELVSKLRHKILHEKKTK